MTNNDSSPTSLGAFAPTGQLTTTTVDLLASAAPASAFVLPEIPVLEEEGLESLTPSILLMLLLDVSGSMKAVLDLLPPVLQQMIVELRATGELGESLRIATVTFSNQAKVLTSFTDLNDTTTALPTLHSEGLTNFGAAFAEARTVIDEGVRSLNRKVYSPWIVFPSDGQHNTGGPWLPAHQALVSESNPLRPWIVTLGWGDADEATLRSIGRTPAESGVEPCYMASTMDPAALASGIAGVIKHSIISAGQSGTLRRRVNL